MTVKLIKEWEGRKVGTLHECEQSVADVLVSTGYAEKMHSTNGVTQDIENATKGITGSLAASIKDAVVEGVKQAHAEQAKAAQAAETKTTGIRIEGPRENILDDPKLGFKHPGEHIKAVIRAASGDIDPRFKAILGQNESDGSQGGYLVVPPEFAPDLIERRLDQPTSILGMCDRYMLTGNALTINGMVDANKSAAAQQYSGVITYWAQEGATITASNLNFRQVKLGLNDLFALVYATNDMLEDAATNMGEKITEASRFALEDTVLEAILFGNGVGKPLGALGSPCLVSIAKETGQTLATGGIVSQNIWGMEAAMPPNMRPDAVWLANSDAKKQIAQLTYNKEVTGGYVPGYMPAGGLSGKPFDTLMGHPLIYTDHCPALGTVGDIAFCNFKQYALALKSSGITSAVSMHVQFVTDQQAFRYKLRVDGRPKWDTYVTPQKGGTTKSPFVAIAVRT